MPNLSLDVARTRLRAVRALMREQKLDALLVQDAADVRYLSGYTGEGVRLFVTARRAYLLASYRNVSRAAEQTAGHVVINTKSRSQFLQDWVAGHNTPTVGLDQKVTHGAFLQRRRSLRPARLKSVDVVRTARAVKSEDEIAILRHAQRTAEGIFDVICSELRPGMTEHHVHNRILQLIYADDTLEGPAFLPICASGPSAWGTHSYYTERRIAKNDCIIFDMGVRYRGYRSDMTRTVFLGKPTRKMREVYAIVLEAQQRAIDAIRAGAPASDAVNAARSHIDECGYGDNFDHGLGHGLGLDVHELPGLSRTGKKPLQNGMVVTVEPGIYIEGKFGVRIEDTVVVRPGGVENLTQAPKELTVIG
ncbi:aminopeptidase P family protein [bacterium]|nr:aminopeptidase P family protein [bacterium]